MKLKRTGAVLLGLFMAGGLALSITGCNNGSAESDAESSAVTDVMPTIPNIDGNQPSYVADPNENVYIPPKPQEGKYMIDDYAIANGKFVESGKDAVVSQTANSIAMHKTGSFRYGSLSARMKLGEAQGDNGIVFAVNSGANSASFWENGTSYYFFFISNRSGYVTLGKVDWLTNPTATSHWTTVTNKRLDPFDEQGEYVLKVEADGTNVKCYVDGELIFVAGDTADLTGGGFGLRAGTAGVTFSDVVFEETEKYVGAPSEDYYEEDGVLKSGSYAQVTKPGVALHKSERFTTGSLTATLISTNGMETGIVFGASDNGQSYYMFTLGAGTRKNYANLSIVENGTRRTLSEGLLSATFNDKDSRTFAVSVVVENGKVYGYFHCSTAQRVCYAAVDLPVPLFGNRVGIYSDASSAMFSEFTKDEAATHRTANMLLFGHSYMELWRNYATDLSEASIDDIGIGGSSSNHWDNESMVNAIASYAPVRGVYMIGINDIGAGRTAEQIASSVATTLDSIHERLPNMKIAFVDINHCTHTKYITAESRAKISAANAKLKEVVAQRDFVYMVDIEYLFCAKSGDASTVIPSYFSDTLHITTGAYTLLANEIKKAFASA